MGLQTEITQSNTWHDLLVVSGFDFASFFPLNFSDLNKSNILSDNTNGTPCVQISSIIGLMTKVGMSNFGNCQILARDWLFANSRGQSHKKLSNVGNFLVLSNVGLPNVGNAKCW